MNEHERYLQIHLGVSEALGTWYINSTPAFVVGDGQCSVKVYVRDLMAAAILSATKTYIIGTRGSGKTLLAEAAGRAVLNEDMLYLRGNKDLTVKDLFVRLNLDGKSEDDIYQISGRMRHLLFLVDELNRCLGLTQNEFLNIGDGYVEIRGTKYHLGNADGYSMMIATGNPPDNGNYGGVFDEDEALIDRIGLILAVDDYPLTELDNMEIKNRRLNKEAIQKGDMREQVLEGNKILKGFCADLNHYFAILSAYIYQRMRFLQMAAGGNATKRTDKTHVDWRALLQQGTHGAGDVLSFASDVSGRSLHDTLLAEALVLHYAAVRGVEGHGDLPTQVLVDTYLEALMLKMRYDRRFLPVEFIRENYEGDVAEFVKKVRDVLKAEIDIGALDECAGLCHEAKEHMAKGRVEEIQKYREFLGAQHRGKPIAIVAGSVLQQMSERVLEKRRMDAIRARLK